MRLRTGTYAIRAFGGDPDSFLVPVIGVALIVVAYLVNVAGSRSVGLLSIIMAVIKVGGIALLGVAGPSAAGVIWQAAVQTPATAQVVSSMARTHLVRMSEGSQKVGR